MTRKERLLQFKNDNNYLRHLISCYSLQISQFEYDGLPETIPADFLEFFLAINGTVAIGLVKELGEDSGIYAAVGGYNGNYNGYLPEEYTAAVTGLGEISGKWYGADRTIIVGKNNLQGAPESDIPFTAEVLTQVDISEACNVIFARCSRLPYANNDKEKAQLESNIQSIIKGDPYAVATRETSIKTQFEDFLDSAPREGEKFLDLVDPDKINGLQYLNQYRDNVQKRFLSKRGYMIQTTSKLAQQTNAEIHGSDSYALLYPLQQLRVREDMCKGINELFGLNVSVRFNDVLSKVYSDYFAAPDVNPDKLPSEGDTPLKNQSESSEEGMDNGEEDTDNE